MGNNVHLFMEGVESSLSVRRFQIREALHGLFQVDLSVRSPDENIPLADVVGRAVGLSIFTDLASKTRIRHLTGVCAGITMSRVEASDTGLTTYNLTIVPKLWLLTQRTNNRLFQHISIPNIVRTILSEWNINADWHIAEDQYPPLELRTQFGESDFSFVSRLLEEAGITFILPAATAPTDPSLVVFNDAPQAASVQAEPFLFCDDVTLAYASGQDFLTSVTVEEQIVPGKFTLRDDDFLRPQLPLFGGAVGSVEGEIALEQYHYQPGSSLKERSEKGLPTPTPVADNLGVARAADARANALASVYLDAIRSSKRRVQFQTNAPTLVPGVTFQMAGHPRLELGSNVVFLVTSFESRGEVSSSEPFVFKGTAVFSSAPWRPPVITPKPTVAGVHNAVVVGPDAPGIGRDDDDIYVDEHGRVRVQFPWDRLGKKDANSSIWMRVSQGWAGVGYGLFTIPRVGHEVLVAYQNGNPDAPIVVGRVHNSVERPPFALPANKTVSTFRTQSSPGGGGFNELRFEDAAGREMIFEHAQRDKNTLVRNDDRIAVGGGATRLVQNDETQVVGGEQCRAVALNEVTATGLNRFETTGGNTSQLTGGDETHVVGGKFSIEMGRGLGRRLADSLGRLLSGPLSATVESQIGTVLGAIPSTALGGTRAAADGPLSALRTEAMSVFRNVLDLALGRNDDPGPAPTTFEMVDRKIRLSTGEAAVVLDGPNINFFADGNITFHSKGSTAVLAEGEAALSAGGRVLVHARGGDLILEGGPNVQLNPFPASKDPTVAGDVLQVKNRIVEDALCDHCGGPLVVDDDGSKVCAELLASTVMEDEQGEGG